MSRGLLALFLFVLLLIPIRWTSESLLVRTAPQEGSTVSVLFVGDMMFDRHIRRVSDIASGDFIFSCVAPALFDADFVVGNLEGPITSNESVSVGTDVGDQYNTRFTFPLQTAALLKRHNIAVVSLANNHALDFGWDGLEETKRSLSAAGVFSFGAPSEEPTFSNVFTLEREGVPMSFIGYNQFSFDGWEAEMERAVKAIAFARRAGNIPIVFAHWGEEYVPVTELQQTVAQRFIDAGAELVVGAHPHVIQEKAFFMSTNESPKPVYYSLGNFIFDQYFSPEVKRGMVLRATFSQEGFVSLEERFVEMTPDGRTCFVSA